MITSLTTQPSIADARDEHLKTLGWGEEELKEHRKGDPKKVKVARQLRKETTVTLAWIAEQLHLGMGTYVTNQHLKDKRWNSSNTRL